MVEEVGDVSPVPSLLGDGPPRLPLPTECTEFHPHLDEFWTLEMLPPGCVISFSLPGKDKTEPEAIVRNLQPAEEEHSHLQESTQRMSVRGRGSSCRFHLLARGDLQPPLHRQAGFRGGQQAARGKSSAKASPSSSSTRQKRRRRGSWLWTREIGTPSRKVGVEAGSTFIAT